MVPKDRKEFLALLRSSYGYNGAEDLAEVKKFIEDGYDLEDESGNPLDVDVIWAKTGRKKITLNTTAVESESEREERLSGKHIGTPARQTGNINRAARVDASMAKANETPFRIGDAISASKKAYDLRAKEGRTCFKEADFAEACVAYLRSANALVNKSTYERLDEDLKICEKAGSHVNMTTGGALVPDDFRAQLIYLSEDFGVARRLANVVPMSRDTATYPRQTGRFSFSFAGENSTVTDSTVPSDQVTLTAKKAIGIARLPMELMDDAAISVADFYARGFAEGIAYIEDYAYLRGDGTSTYGGIVGVTSAPWFSAVAQGTSNTWSAQVEADINNLVSRPDNVLHRNCAFVCSRQYFCQVLMPMIAANGRGSMNEFLSVNGQGGVADAQWKGWPVYFSQVMPTSTATSQTPLLFGDFRAGTMFGDRKELTIVQSDQRYFEYDQIGLRATQRFAINCHGDGRGSTYGPIAGLKTS